MSKVIIPSLFIYSFIITCLNTYLADIYLVETQSFLYLKFVQSIDSESKKKLRISEHPAECDWMSNTNGKYKCRFQLANWRDTFNRVFVGPLSACWASDTHFLHRVNFLCTNMSVFCIKSWLLMCRDKHTVTSSFPHPLLFPFLHKASAAIASHYLYV